VSITRQTAIGLLVGSHAGERQDQPKTAATLVGAVGEMWIMRTAARKSAR
jgi:hypothetical protein